MSKPPVSPAGEASEPVIDDRLDSWKEIAIYLGRDIRTLYRWEADEGLPVHRHLHKKRGTVYAYRTELDAWRMNRGLEGRWQSAGESTRAPAGALVRYTRTAIATAGVAVLVVAALSLTFWLRTPAVPLTDKDVLVLAEFSNTTGDGVFDTTLREALAAQLEESPFLKVMSDDQMRQDLDLMARPAGERVTNPIARQICLREGSKAIIGGAIASLGRAYGITLQATECQSGDTLAREQAEAEDREHVLRALATAATKMRARLGESLNSIQKLDRRDNVQVTTPSLEAFQAYALGREQDNQTAWPAAIALYQRATELDPSFAMAHLLLGQKFNNLGEVSRRQDYFKRAFALVDHVSDRERLFISGLYYSQVTFETDRAAEIWQSHVRLYPRESSPHNYLGGYYMRRGEYATAAEHFREAIRLDARDAVFRGNLVWALASLGRYDEAKAAAEKAFHEGVDGFSIHRRLLHLAYLESDRAAAGKEISRFVGTPLEYQSLNLQAEDANAHGRRREASEFTRRAVDLARRGNLLETAALSAVSSAETDALFGKCDQALTAIRTLIPRRPQPDNATNVALTLALCGDTTMAQKLVEDVSRQLPDANAWSASSVPAILAAMELSRDRPAKALDLLPSFPGDFASMYLKALAHLRLGHGADAARAFQKILDEKGAYANTGRPGGDYGFFYAPSCLGVARAASISGDITRAKEAYENFFDLWRDADPDIPILQQARKEYAAMH